MDGEKIEDYKDLSKYMNKDLYEKPPQGEAARMNYKLVNNCVKYSLFKS